MDIYSAEFIISNTDVAKCPKPNLPEIAFIGRSNVGKSSLMNMLLNKKDLAKTSATPGKTQLVNHFLINKNMYWVDLPGYGFAKVSQSKRNSWVKMIWNYVEQRDNLLTLFVLIDSRHSPQQIDIDFVNKLGEKGVPFSLIFTKADKESQKQVNANVSEFTQKLEQYWDELPKHFVSSAVKRSGRQPLLDYIGELQTKYDEEIKANQQQKN